MATTKWGLTSRSSINNNLNKQFLAALDTYWPSAHIHTFYISASLLLFHFNVPIPVAARSKTSVCWDCGFESHRGHGCLPVCCECCVLSGRGLCVELITRPEEPYRLWCVVVCDLESSWMRTPWPWGLLRQIKKKKTRLGKYMKKIKSSMLLQFICKAQDWKCKIR